MGHFIDQDGSIFVDTDFVNRVQRLPGVSLRHLGFGEFEVQTDRGSVEVDRMRGQPFEGQSGRSHKFYDNKGGTHIALELVKEMERKGLSEPSVGQKTASIRNANDLMGRLQHIVRQARQGNPSRVALAAQLRKLAAEVERGS